MTKLAIEGGKPIRDKLLKFHQPYFGQEEIDAAIGVIKSGKVCGDGYFGRLLEKELVNRLNVRFAFLTNSCTSALELAMMSLGVGPGDEVILPSFSFVSAANAIVLRGGKPVFGEIDEATFNLDPREVQKLINSRTKGIIVVHYGGFSCDMEALLKVAKDNNLFVVEDAAQALGAEYNGKSLGTMGDVGCFSFHETKNITCGEGGCFVTNNEEIAKKIEIMREKGTNRSSFMRGQIDKYSWVDIGSSYVISDILAAVAYEQFKKIDHIIKIRTHIADSFIKYLSGLSQKIVLPSSPIYCKSNWHIFAIRVSVKGRDWLLKTLRAEGIEVTFHFVPLHLSPYAKLKLKYKEGDFPITERISASLLRVPIYPDLNGKDLRDIVNAFNKVLTYRGDKF